MSSQTAIEKILDRRIGEGSQLYYLVRWKQGLQKEETWVRADSLRGAEWQVHQFNKKLSSSHQEGAGSKKLKTATTVQKNSIDQVELQIFAGTEKKEDDREGTLTNTVIREYAESEPIVQSKSISVESQKHKQISALSHELDNEKLAAQPSTDCRGHPKKHIGSEPTRSVEFIVRGNGLQKYAVPARMSQLPSERMRITPVLSITIGQAGDRQFRTTTTLLQKVNVNGPLELKEQEDGRSFSQALSSFEESQIRLLNAAICKVVRMREEAYPNLQPFILHRGTRDLMDFKFEIKSKPRHRRYKSLKDHKQNMKIEQARQIIPLRRQLAAGEKAEVLQQSSENISFNGERFARQRLASPFQYGRQLTFTPFDYVKRSTTNSLDQLPVAENPQQEDMEPDLKEQFELQSVELPDESVNRGEPSKVDSRIDGTWMSEIKELRAYKSKKVVRVLASTGQEHIIEYELAKRLAPDLLLEFLTKKNVHPQSRPRSGK